MHKQVPYRNGNSIEMTCAYVSGEKLTFSSSIIYAKLNRIFLFLKCFFFLVPALCCTKGFIAVLHVYHAIWLGLSWHFLPAIPLSSGNYISMEAAVPIVSTLLTTHISN